MLRTLIVGALAAVGISRLKKAYDTGKLDPYIDRAKGLAGEVQDRYEDRVSARTGTPGTGTLRKPAPAPVASSSARVSSSDSPSQPSKASPWPADTRAISGNA